MTSSPAAEPRAKRADAVRNREAVVLAAAAVFGERGPDAGVDEIAARAGVGKATVYRSFPTKEHLIAAVSAERLRWLADITEQALEATDVDGWTSLREILRAAGRTRARGMLAVGLVSDCEDPELLAAKEAARNAGERLLARAQADGSARPDITHAELVVLFRGVTLALTEVGERDPEVWTRLADLVADAVRPQPS